MESSALADCIALAAAVNARNSQNQEFGLQIKKRTARTSSWRACCAPPLSLVSLLREDDYDWPGPRGPPAPPRGKRPSARGLAGPWGARAVPTAAARRAACAGAPARLWDAVRRRLRVSSSPEYERQLLL